MIYLQTYNEKQSIVKKLSLKEADEWIKKNSIDSGDIIDIYRKDENGFDNCLRNSLKYKKPRKAPWAKVNLHNIILSNLDSWKNIPKRNKSFICGNLDRSLDHCKPILYNVFPKRNTKIATCGMDFWEVFYPDISIDLPDIFKKIDWILPHYDDNNWNDVKNKINSIPKDEFLNIFNYLDIKNIDKKKTNIEIINKYFKPPGSIKILKYNRKDFKWSNLDKGINIYREFWFEGEALFKKHKL